MKIKNIISQLRRDFNAILVCEHCETEYLLTTGYDDDNYHMNVIPNMACKYCGKKAPEDYRALTTKYAAHEIV